MADSAGAGVAEQGRGEHPENDRNRLAIFGRQDQRQQLGLVADFGERDDAGGDEKGVEHRDESSRPERH